MKLILALAFIFIATSASAATSIPVSGDHSGVTDTASITNACKKGQIPSLNGGVYYVSQITNCRVIRGDGGTPAYFWYEGETDVTTVVGVGGGRGVITCPAGTACRYTGFTVNPGPGQACVVMDGVHGLQLDAFNCIDPAAQGGDCIDARALSGNQNQLLKVIGGVFIHCGGMGLNASAGAGLNDSLVIGANFSNNQAGNINIGAGFGNIWSLNKIEDAYGQNGMTFSGPLNTAGDSVIIGNVFDLNNASMQFTGNWYGVVAGNMECNNQGSGMFDIESTPNLIAGGINVSCGPTYKAAPGITPTLDFADPIPSYFDATSQSIVGPSVHP